MGKKITEREVKLAQKDWAKAIVDIGKVYMKRGDLVKSAKGHIEELYDYDSNGKNIVLFKPTKCKVVQFRPTIEGAISYFIGHEFAQYGFSEDQGFAIAPYSAVHFVQHNIIEAEGRAIAMGNYFFIKADGSSTKVEYTFGYRRRKNKLVIDLHHSSLPFSG